MKDHFQIETLLGTFTMNANLLQEDCYFYMKNYLLSIKSSKPNIQEYQ